MLNYIKLILLGGVILFAALAANWAHDLAYQVHALLILAVGIVMFVWVLRQTDEPVAVSAGDATGYMDGPVRYGIIATALWGVVGFLVGTFIAFQLAFPVLNFDWAQPFANFGRLRPLHTSAVIFAFGGNGLIATSFGSSSGATICLSCWPQLATFWALRNPKSTPNRNGISTFG